MKIDEPMMKSHNLADFLEAINHKIWFFNHKICKKGASEGEGVFLIEEIGWRKVRAVH